MDIEQVNHVARLARLKLSDGGAAAMTEQLGKVLDYITVKRSLATSGDSEERRASSDAGPNVGVRHTVDKQGCWRFSVGWFRTIPVQLPRSSFSNGGKIVLAISVS